MRDENACTLYAYDLAGRTVVVTDTPSAGSGQSLGRMTRTFHDTLGWVQATVSNVRLNSRRRLEPGYAEFA